MKRIVLQFSEFQCRDDGTLACQFSNQKSTGSEPFTVGEGTLKESVEKAGPYRYLSIGDQKSRPCFVVIIDPAHANCGKVEAIDWEGELSALGPVVFSFEEEKTSPTEEEEKDKPALTCHVSYEPDACVMMGAGLAPGGTLDLTNRESLHRFFELSEPLKAAFNRYVAGQAFLHHETDPAPTLSLKSGGTLQQFLNNREVLILYAHGQAAQTGGYWHGSLALCGNTPNVTSEVGPEILAENFKAAGHLPPVIVLASCHGAAVRGDKPSFAAQLLHLLRDRTVERDVLRPKCIVAYKNVVPGPVAIHQAIMLCKFFTNRTLRQSFLDAFFLSYGDADVQARIFVRDSKMEIRTRRESVLHSDAKILDQLKAKIKLAKEENEVTPPAFVIGTGFFPGYHHSVRNKAGSMGYPFTGITMRDPCEINIALYRQFYNEGRDKNEWGAEQADLFGGGDPATAMKLFDKFVELKPRIVFNLTRSKLPFDLLKKARRRVTTFFTSPSLPICKIEQIKELKQLLDGLKDGNGTLLFQPFGVATNGNATHTSLIEEMNVFAARQDDVIVASERKRLLTLSHISGGLPISSLIAESTTALLTWLCPQERAPQDLTSEFDEYLRSVGLTFLGVSPDLLETRVFLAWLSAQSDLNLSNERVFIHANFETVGTEFREGAEPLAHLVDMIRWQLRISPEDQERKIARLYSPLEDVLDYLLAPKQG